ncbi:hypothetical protein GUITHDRAFT_164690 [Guillardia theta CCMP2712]|uniref:Uncharacterized protein n=1 Tax=Guillardia theta (strain CCMP2712) TaxID=905079 RepID=L1IWR1_GUITC|nr:hypothetical protein GUITHDRAFT_164690 [Guillardia theta CCMP2712]EKX40289.1 hypothetical protein GUITHDRAFT_164690 [Guillardia theta CCMP2712]|eukprot:XP_005827269.1 hypothetical protein GUITHDRAFT_164690 [Guillardia theta CCMP2712]
MERALVSLSLLPIPPSPPSFLASLLLKALLRNLSSPLEYPNSVHVAMLSFLLLTFSDSPYSTPKLDRNTDGAADSKELFSMDPDELGALLLNRLRFQQEHYDKLKEERAHEEIDWKEESRALARYREQEVQEELWFTGQQKIAQADHQQTSHEEGSDNSKLEAHEEIDWKEESRALAKQWATMSKEEKERYRERRWAWELRPNRKRVGGTSRQTYNGLLDFPAPDIS